MTSNEQNLMGSISINFFDSVDVGWRFVKIVGAADARWIKGTSFEKHRK